MGITSQFDGQVSLTFPFRSDVVWRRVADLERIGEWSPECTGITWVAPATGPAPGARFVGRNRIGPIRWRTTCTLTAWEPERLLAYDARHVTGAVTRWTFELTERGDTTVVTQRFATVDSPWFMMLGDRVAGRPRRLLSGMEATLRAMRDSISPR
ncbi:SRPBCC family protein [Nocardioides marmoriginsengisoli]|uniref:SRPBCC family protein n=1 Tax=Nocardioides marmoriginsengisoli TaxID=661483 RepID=UPI00160D551A|nr:SRPBCC family protein [Nocardioides marmoriginsengisoli]